MHFNFHLSGDESPEQSRRIANAVLALGGLLGAKTDIVQTHVIRTGELSPELRQAFKDGASANVSVGYRSESTRAAECAAIDLARSSEPHLTEAEQFAGALTGDEIRAVESLPPAPPIPAVPGNPPPAPGVAESLPPAPVLTTDKNGLPWDERIHSSSRAINAGGTWRYRKNVPDETKRDVEAELKGLVTGAVSGKGSYVITSVGIVDEQVLNDPNTVISPPVPPLPPTPPAPPLPTGALQRTYSDVVNLIMSRKVQPDTYVAILGMSLPEFAKHVISAPNDATLMFDALDAASRP